MAIYSEAIYKPLTVDKGRQRMLEYNRVNLHVAVSEAQSLYAAFNGRGRTDSHFYVRRSGIVEQYVDTAFRANADLQGNDATISIETQGGTKNADSEPWTDAQVAALAKLYAWAVKTHGIQVKIADSSKLGTPSKGLSWHRLGIDGNFPNMPSIFAGRLQRGGGMHYSKSRGKLCPGSHKIAQVQEVFDLADVAPAPAPKPPTPPAPKPDVPQLRVDGYWGTATTKRLQQVLKTVVDGTVSQQPRVHKRANPGLVQGWKWTSSRRPQGSLMIAALQRQLAGKGLYKGDIDGLFGPASIAALQRALGTVADGKVSKESTMVKRLQRNLNENKLF